MFIIVKYGSLKEKLFNPNCATKILLQAIRQLCGLTVDQRIDLATESGVLCTFEQDSMSNALEKVTYREIYYLILLEQLEDQVVYKPHSIGLDENSTLIRALTTLNNQKSIQESQMLQQQQQQQQLQQQQFGKKKGSQTKLTGSANNAGIKRGKSTTNTAPVANAGKPTNK